MALILDISQCQLMAVGANSLPTGIQFACSEEGNFIQCKQLNGDIARL